MTIAEVCERFGLSQDTLRYYEKIGLIPTVQRKASGIRNYTEEDCKWIEFIKCMRSAGLTIEFLSEYVKLFKEGDSTLDKRRNLLIEQRNHLKERMLEMQATLDRLDRKVERYDTLVSEKEKHLKSNRINEEIELLG
ncbi:MAG: MerR family transcriptional regulator [Erysipelotrichaceae bacterium]|nr:MerR family transcriptional regulator [Erysipelotrichaceae bacterium]